MGVPVGLADRLFLPGVLAIVGLRGQESRACCSTVVDAH